MVHNCTFKTMLLENPLYGRNHFYDFLNALTISHPDMVFVIKNCRVTNKQTEGRFIKFRQYFSGNFFIFQIRIRWYFTACQHFLFFCSAAVIYLFFSTNNILCYFLFFLRNQCLSKSGTTILLR